MFSKIFEQIFDSSIAEDWQVRLVFEDFLTLADIDGVVDKTPEAISRRTNVPLEIIKRAITVLESPDIKSRRPDSDGRRIVRLDDHREWGWLIVNYEYYRSLASEEQRRSRTRERVRKYRDKPECNAPVTQGNDSPSPSPCPSSCIPEGGYKGETTDKWTLADCQSAASTLCMLPKQVEDFWAHYASVDFVDGAGRRITNLKAALQKWKVNQSSHGKKMGRYTETAETTLPKKW